MEEAETAAETAAVCRRWLTFLVVEGVVKPLMLPAMCTVLPVNIKSYDDCHTLIEEPIKRSNFGLQCKSPNHKTGM